MAQTRQPRGKVFRPADLLRQLNQRISKRAYNQLLVRANLYRRGSMSRLELGRATGLPLSALTSVCSDLIEQGLVAESQRRPAAHHRRGRPRTQLQIASDQLGVIALRYDVPVFLEAVVADLAGNIRWRRRYDAPGGRLPDELIATLKKALGQALQASPIPRSRLVAVGCADPGLVDRATGRALRAVNLPGWENVPIMQILAPLAKVPILLERQDGLRALGEVYFGAGRGARSVLFLGLQDEGVGGGLVEDGRLVAGHHGGAGEIGHTNVDPRGLRCDCGLLGCLEAHIKPARLLQRLWESHPATRDRITDFPGLLAAAREGDVTCRPLLDEAADLMARAIGNAVNLLNPERAVLGGYVADAGELILDPLRRALPRYTLREYHDSLDIRLGKLGDDAIYFGIVAEVRERIFAFPLKEMFPKNFQLREESV